MNWNLMKVNLESDPTLVSEFFGYIARFRVRCFSLDLICWLKNVCPFYGSKICLNNWWKLCTFVLYFNFVLYFYFQCFHSIMHKNICRYYQTFVEVLTRAVLWILCPTKVYLHKPQHNKCYFVYKWFSSKHCLPVVLFKYIYHHK